MEKFTMMKERDLIVVKPEGEILSRSYPEIEKLILADITLWTKVIINMEKVDLINSQGFMFLIKMRNMISLNEGFFSLYNITKNVESIIYQLRLEEVLNISSSIEKCFRKIMVYENRRLSCSDFSIEEMQMKKERALPATNVK